MKDSSPVMEGILWKWTNYFSGWQPRWFVLEDGNLSYYKSQDDVINGCKGSVKMSVCDVTVHPSDHSRLDLIIPGEAHFYVKAATAQERQQWLVALGSCKACLANGQPGQLRPEEMPSELLKAKKSELRLYCDLLMQQVHSVKSAVQMKDGPEIGQVNEATSLLSATCDTFIQTLDECMQMAHANELPPSPSRKSPSSRTVPWSLGSIQRSMSVESMPSRRQSPIALEDTIVRGYIPTSRRGIRSSGHSSSRIHSISESESTVMVSTNNRVPINDTPITENGTERVTTFFSSMPVRFSDIYIDANGNVTTDTFLDACRALLPIFDILNATTFAPVKLDFSGNIKKIAQKYSTETEKFSSLQKMVLYEITAKQYRHSSSATLALLWLKRGLEFIVELCREFVRGADELTLASNVAYTKTLRPFHNIVNRGSYALMVKTAPNKEEFLRHLTFNATVATEPHVEKMVKEDISQFIHGLDKLLEKVNLFYTQQDLDFQELV